MKPTFNLVLSASAASVLAFTALAQENPEPKKDRQEYGPLPSASRGARGTAQRPRQGR